MEVCKRRDLKADEAKSKVTLLGEDEGSGYEVIVTGRKFQHV